MAGYFQKTTTAGSGVPRVKHSSGYSSLQTAFDDLQSGDTLLINQDYTLSATVQLTKNDVQIIGLGGLIKPQSNGTPLLLFGS